MKTASRLLVVVAGVTAAASAVAWAGRSAGDPAARTVTITGVLVEPPADGRMLVAHDEVAGYMPAMTMPFAVERADAAKLSGGDRVRFTLRVSGTESRVEDIVVTGREVRPAATAGREPSAPRLKPGGQVAPFALVDQNGRPVGASDFAGRVTAVNFVFTRCPVPEFCPTTVSRTRQVQAAIAADATLRSTGRLLSVTLDPEFDTPAVLSAYARSVGADSTRWRFLTGDADAVRTFARAFAIHTERNGAFLDHTLATAVIDNRGRVVQIWRGSEWSRDEVLTAMRAVAVAE